MGASAGKVTVDEGEGTGISTTKAGNTSDDDEDMMWSYGDDGGGGILEGNVPQYQQTIEGVQILEQVRPNLAHQRHRRLNPRQLSESNVLSGAVTTVEGIMISVVSKISDILEVPSSTPIVSPILGSPTLSIVLPTPLVPSPTNIIPDVPIGSSLQTVLSSTPPSSPVETSAEMTILPTITTSSSVSTGTTQPPSRDTGSTNTGPSTTITSYWISQAFRNGTSLGNIRTTAFTSTVTASTTTIDGTVIVFTFPTGTSGLGSFRNSSSQSSTFSSNSSSSITNRTTSTISSTLSTSLWTTDGAGGAGGGYVAPTGDTPTAPLPTSTEGPSRGGSPPVSPSLLGGILGGVAGLAFVLVAILFLLRRHRQAVAAQQRDDAGYGGPLGVGGADQMTQRSITAPFAFTGGFFGRHPRQGQVSQGSETPTTAPPTEVGFYKVSGRKLPPVLGGPRPGYGSTRSGGSSVYPDDDGVTVASTAGPSRYSSMTAASASPTSSSAPMSFVAPSAPVSSTHPHASSSMAPPPPRIPEEAAESDNDSTHQLPRPPPFPRQLSAISVGSVGKDGVGRSLPSHDGSRASRFTEDIV